MDLSAKLILLQYRRERALKSRGTAAPSSIVARDERVSQLGQEVTAMSNEPEFLRKAAAKSVETNDRQTFARVMVNSAHVRNFVWMIARRSDPDEGRLPGRATLGVILRRIANRIRDVDDPALARLGQADHADGFQLALGRFLHATVRQVLTPPAPRSGVAREIAGVLLAAGLDGDVVEQLAELRSSSSACLIGLTTH